MGPHALRHSGSCIQAGTAFQGIRIGEISNIFIAPAMRTLPCPRCTAAVPTLEDLPAPVRISLIHSYRTSGAMGAMALLRSAGYTPAEAKAAALHLSRSTDICHRCHREVSGRGAVSCAHCGCLNLNRMEER